eukprot:m.110188 g.110188  ORF g.110188 m.110188 type:complete len:1047 (-) comp22707_c2_seq2:318-3458(-)
MERVCKPDVLDRLDEELLSPLHYAARGDHGRVIELLLDKHADIFVKGEEDQTPLHVAARANSVNAIQALQKGLKDRHDIDKTDAYKTTPLHNATMRGHFEAVGKLLSFHADPNVKDNAALTPLHLAASYNHCRIATALISYGADLFAEDIDKGIPIHSAAMTGSYDMVQLLIEEAADDDKGKFLSATDREGNTALHLAIENGYPKVAELLLKNGSRAIAVNQVGRTPLHLAAELDSPEICRLLIERYGVQGQHILTQDHNGFMPIHRGALHNSVNAVRYLLKQEASPHHVNSGDKEGFTPLLLASWKGHKEMAALLLQNGADPYLSDSVDKTVLHWAVEEMHGELVTFLLENIPDISKLLRSEDRGDRTVLHAAAEKGAVEIAANILRHAEPPDHDFLLEADNDFEQNVMHVAASFGRLPFCKFLIKMNNNLLFDEDEDSNTPLHLAALQGHSSTCEALIVAGASVTATNDRKWTPLDCAAVNGQEDVIEVLIDNQAPLDPLDNNGVTPFMLACMHGHVGAVNTFLNHNSDISLITKNGLNGLDLAVLHGQFPVCAAIISHSRWREAIEPRTQNQEAATSTQLVSNSKRMTPMKRMIISMPEAALLALKRCRHTTKEEHNTEEREPRDIIHYDFTLIDEKMSGDLEEVETVPLHLMKRYNRTDLLSHQVVSALLDLKWRKFGLFFFNLNLVAYLLFLTFLTVFVVENNVHENNENLSLGSRAAQLLVVIFSVFRLVVEVLQLANEKLRYFYDFLNYVEWILFVLSLCFMLPFNEDKSVSQWTCGAFAVFLGWINLIMFVRIFNTFGIYVLMFQETLKTALQVLGVFSLFVVGFAFSFYILLQDSYHFGQVGRSLMKTFVMMTGEFEYADYFEQQRLRFDVLSYFIFVLFIVLMPILLMNLLVGLAVGDVEGVMENAKLERLKMQVEFILPLQQFLIWLRRHFLNKSEDPFFRAGKTSEDLKHTKWGFLTYLMSDTSSLLFWEEEEVTVMQKLQDDVENLQDTMGKIQRDVDKITATVGDLSTLVEAIMKATTKDLEHSSEPQTSAI